MKHVAYFILIVTLAACGGGGGEAPAPILPAPDPDASVGGVWHGTSTNSLQPGVIQFDALILEDGQGRAGDENLVTYEIDVSSDGDEFSGTVRVYAFPGGVPFPGGATVLDGTISGTIDERDMMVGTWTASGETGDFEMAYDAPGYEIDVTLAGVADTWTFDLRPDIDFWVTVTIDAAGNLNGQDSQGCVYSGTLTDPAFQGDQFNGLLLDWEISDVGGCFIVGNYSGQAALIEDATDPDVLLISTDDDAIVIAFPFVRQ
jgi:hypothetical protein